MKKLILWDIDGTLITSGGAGERALIRALAREFGCAGLAGVELAGRTDVWIAAEALRGHGRPAAPPEVRRFLDAYLEVLADELPLTAGGALPGVAQALNAVRQRQHLIQGLLTGNLAAGARLKLERFGLWHYFEFGAFADDHHDRNELGPCALRRLREKRLIDLAAADVTVIGDTPHDIACGKAFGARTLAVATGRYSCAELAVHAPDLCLPNLSDTAELLRWLDPEPTPSAPGRASGSE